MDPVPEMILPRKINRCLYFTGPARPQRSGPVSFYRRRAQAESGSDSGETLTLRDNMNIQGSSFTGGVGKIINFKGSIV